jgi:hypothetical protein
MLGLTPVRAFFGGEIMRVSWTLCAAILLLTWAADISLGAEPTSNRLAKLAAQKSLCDRICYAKADGTISRFERLSILMDAKEVLSHEEYLKFKKVLDRIAPPPKNAPASHLAKTKTMHKKTPAPKPPVQEEAGESQSGPVLPAGVMLPDPVAPPVLFR